MQIEKSSFGGYVGEYNGNILKSSYEYIFAKILEYDDIKYTVEECTYLLDHGETYYTPDFFLCTNSGELYEIIEIRGHRLNIEERIESTDKLRELLSNQIDITLYTEIDIRRMCKERGLSYHQLKMDWRTNPKNIKGSSKGEINSMYGKHHTQKTKMLISSVKKAKAKENPEKYRELGEQLAEWGRQNNWYYSKQKRVPRHVLRCRECDIEFIVTPSQKNKRVFCSTQCACIYNARLATNVTVESRKNRDEELRNFILNWAMNNKDIVISAPYNKIIPSLKGLLDLIEEEFNAIDFRTISRSMGTKHRKDFLKALKEYVE